MPPSPATNRYATGASLNGAYIAVDWGTTNRRIHLVSADGTSLAAAADGLGVASLAGKGFTEAIADLRKSHGDLPILAAGMIGSSLGVVEVPYVATPATLETLAAKVTVRRDLGLTIVPGVSHMADGVFDVMRGEETLSLGAVAAGLTDGDGLVIQPGTHNKWIRLSRGRIVTVATAMIGELFALIRDHSILSGMMTGQDVTENAAFLDGVLASVRVGGHLTSDLFGVRAGVLLGHRAKEDAAARVSGLLIGADINGRFAVGETVTIVADARLARLYAAAIKLVGGRPRMIDARTAFLAGIHEIWKRLS